MDTVIAISLAGPQRDCHGALGVGDRSVIEAKQTTRAAETLLGLPRSGLPTPEFGRRTVIADDSPNCVTHIYADRQALQQQAIVRQLRKPG
ncbi:hypothetical protein AJ88_34815 [Mesorhizobium amorphae CCBAU 01583]|nr:hypothetical protein AJ88_34815 [Mesorhizobium amorphae CCBAU 01583]